AHETALYDLAHSTEMAVPQVRSLRDLGVTLGQRVLETQAPIPEADLAVEFARLRIPASQRAALVKLAGNRVGADVVTTVRSLDMRRTPPGLTPSRRAARVVVPVIGADVESALKSLRQMLVLPRARG